MNNNKKQKGNRRLLLIIAVLASVFIVAAFLISPIVFKRAKTLNCPHWTGFCETQVTTTTTKENYQTTVSKQIHSGKTLWDWLELVGTLGVPILLLFLGQQFQQRYKEKSEANLSEGAIQAYLDSMAKLLLSKELRKELFPNVNDKLNPSGCDNPVRDVARIETITILRRLEGDTERQAIILRFLRDAELYEFILNNANLRGANLEKANLEGANLEKANLWGANLEGANLRRANLKEADLERANLRRANLKEADLEEANLEEANLDRANLERANLEGAKLLRADLEEANLRRANLKKADLRGADLEKAKLLGAKLKEADLWEANLRRANLEKANLEEAKLWGADLWEAKLLRADLEEADLRGAKLWEADLEKANFTDAKNLTFKQIKFARFGEKAIYNEKDESLNQKYIQELKKDKYLALIFRSIYSQYLYLISKLKRIIQSRNNRG